MIYKAHGQEKPQVPSEWTITKSRQKVTSLGITKIPYNPGEKVKIKEKDWEVWDGNPKTTDVEWRLRISRYVLKTHGLRNWKSKGKTEISRAFWNLETLTVNGRRRRPAPINWEPDTPSSMTQSYVHPWCSTLNSGSDPKTLSTLTFKHASW